MESVVIYKSFVDATQCLPPKDYKEFWTAIFEYALEGKEPDGFKSEVAEVVFTMARPQIDANTRRKNNGSKGGRPKKDEECSQPPPITILLKTGEEYPVSKSEIDEWSKIYTHIDVQYELQRMKMWCISNPKKRKTEEEINKFITGWLENGEKAERNKPKGKPGFKTHEQRVYDFEELEKQVRAN